MIQNDNFDLFASPGIDSGETAGSAAGGVATLELRASNVTGTRQLPLQVGRDLSVGDVTSSIADLMSLPDDVAWALRADRGQFLDERGTVGEQLEPGAHVTITPRTHLG